MRSAPALRYDRQRVTITSRDRRILDATAAKLRGPAEFGDIVRALCEATEEIIAGGRVFLLGATADGPILGSIISGIGLVDRPDGTWIVRARPDVRMLARFAR